ncbi:MAG: 3-deoxy-D-manno-octulosonic acid transferase [Paracoccaceae bacterium]
MQMPLTLRIYLFLSRHAMGPARVALRRRQRRGKEDAGRIGERLGTPGLPRPAGQLVWFHAASVGESLSVIELIRRLLAGRPDLHCLVTTGTRTSAALLAERLPERAFHQYVPVDAMPAVRAFLDHWKPDVAVWTESELWPALVSAAHRRGVPLLMLNARMSGKSFRQWRYFRSMARHLLGKFTRIYAQDEVSAERFRGLGFPPERLKTTGSLKEGSVSLPHDESELVRLRSAMAGRPLWCAASTHGGEEEAALEAHRLAKRRHPGLLLVLVPRHPARGDDIAALVQAGGLRMHRRSKGEQPTPETDVYLADTLGEMGLWYRLAPVSFVGGSLAPVGGHNPFEPAGLGSAILFGPHVENFADIYERLESAGGARRVADAAELGEALRETLEPDAAAAMATAAWAACSEGTEITDRALALLEGTLRHQAAA